MISRGTPDGLACFGAIAQCPAGRDMVLRPLGQEIVPNPPIRQSPFLFYPQEFRDTDCILRVWPSVPRRELDYLRGPPGPQNPAAAILTPHDWEQVQDMAVLLLLWLEHSNSRRGRIYMPLFGHEVTVELWCGPETSRVPWNIVTPWL
ncbi:hypothetical protein MMC17_001001 [Xylographa soralifera]|nr:hypothetical protein [Xylographa soralifera]